MTTRYLDPGNDIAFKKLFNKEDHKSLLISYLNAILELEGRRKIKSIEFLPQEQIPLNKESKTSILDVRCTDERNYQYIVEMQNKKVPEFVKRIQYYTAHNYVSQAKKGSNHLELKPVILLATLKHEIFPDKEKYISYHKTLDIHTYENDLEDLSYVFVELPKFLKEESELETIQDKWIYFFKNWNKTKEIPSQINEPELIEAYKIMEEYNWSREEIDAYIKTNLAFTEEQEARRKEREEGREEGEKAKALEIAKTLLQNEMSPIQVAEMTKLSLEEVQTPEKEKV